MLDAQLAYAISTLTLERCKLRAFAYHLRFVIAPFLSSEVPDVFAVITHFTIHVHEFERLRETV
jgi:hypothetical protein